MSSSGIKKFRKCPRQWWYHYVSNYEEVMGETKYLDLGNAVHEAIEKWLKPDSPDGLDTLLAHYQRLQLYHGVPEDMVEVGEQCCRKAFDFVADQDPTILGIEEKARFNINRPDVQTEVFGKMDVATDTEIWDWKTGSIRDDTPVEEKIQGATYMAAYNVLYGKPPEKIRFIYLKEEAVRSLDPSDEVWNVMLTHARKLTVAKQNDRFPAKPGNKCYWCGYEKYCDAAAGTGGDFDWEDWMRL